MAGGNKDALCNTLIPMKIRLILLNLSVACCVSMGHSQESKLVAEVSLGSMFVDRGLQLGDLTWHPSIEWSSGDAYLGLWTAMPLEHKGSPDHYNEEYDVYGGYGWALTSDLALDVGFTHYGLADHPDTFEIYAGLSKELGTFSPAFYIYRDFDLKTLTIELSSGVALPLDGFPGEVGLYAGHVDYDEGPGYTYYGVDLIYPVELGKGMRCEIGLHFADNDIGLGVPDSRIYGSTAFSVAF